MLLIYFCVISVLFMSLSRSLIRRSIMAITPLLSSFSYVVICMYYVVVIVVCVGFVVFVVFLVLLFGLRLI